MICVWFHTFIPNRTRPCQNSDHRAVLNCPCPCPQTKKTSVQIHNIHRNMYTCTLTSSKNRLQRNWLRSDQTMRPRAVGPSGCQRARISCAPMEWSTNSRGGYNVVHNGRRGAPLPEIAQLAAIILDERLPRDGANGSRTSASGCA